MLELNFTPFPNLKTERLSLRKIVKSDAPEIFLIRSNENVRDYANRPPDTSIKQAHVHIDKLHEIEKKNEGIAWAIAMQSDDKLIGTICFWNIVKEHDRSEIGYALHQQYHRKGIMQEAMTAVLDYGFLTMKLHSVEAKLNPQNVPSIKLLERNNFVREGYFKEDFYFDGKYYDTAVYSLLNPFKK